MSLTKEISIMVAGDNVSKLSEILNYIAETEQENFINNLEEDCVEGPISGVDHTDWEEEVDQYFSLINNHDGTSAHSSEIENQLEKVSMITKGHIYCEVVRFQNHHNI